MHLPTSHVDRDTRCVALMRREVAHREVAVRACFGGIGQVDAATGKVVIDKESMESDAKLRTFWLLQLSATAHLQGEREVASARCPLQLSP